MQHEWTKENSEIIFEICSKQSVYRFVVRYSHIHIWIENCTQNTARERKRRWRIEFNSTLFASQRWQNQIFRLIFCFSHLLSPSLSILFCSSSILRSVFLLFQRSRSFCTRESNYSDRSPYACSFRRGSALTLLFSFNCIICSFGAAAWCSHTERRLQ